MTETKPIDGNGAWKDVRVSLGPDAEVTGKLSFATPTRIEGKLKGELRASDLLVIGSQALMRRGQFLHRAIDSGRRKRWNVSGATNAVICSIVASRRVRT